MARDHVSVRAARLIPALLLAAPLAAEAQTTVPRPARPIVVPPPVMVVPGYPVPLAEYHGAIAYNRATGAYGYSFDYPTPRDAGIAAINGCGETQCIVAIAFKSGCGCSSTAPRPGRGRRRQRARSRSESARALHRSAMPGRCLGVHALILAILRHFLSSPPRGRRASDTGVETCAPVSNRADGRS